ncbi:MAG: hypothetical protein NTU41_09600, partial [Chloroflexi bacterium]|nr:hypothetical protein [Chloroflexota bacterium]
LIAQASEIASRMKEEAKVEARKEAEALVVRAQAQIGSDREEAFNQLRREFADLAVTAAERVISQAVDRKAHQQIIDKVLQEGLASRKN